MSGKIDPEKDKIETIARILAPVVPVNTEIKQGHHEKQLLDPPVPLDRITDSWAYDKRAVDDMKPEPQMAEDTWHQPQMIEPTIER